MYVPSGITSVANPMNCAKGMTWPDNSPHHISVQEPYYRGQWLTPIMPENGILVNPKMQNGRDSRGDLVKVISALIVGEWDLGAGNKNQ